MLTKRPLLDTGADQALFVVDGSRRRALQSAFQHRNTLIFGEAGAGKTSLLYQIRANANSMTDLALVVFANAGIAEDAQSLVDLIVREAEEAGWIEAAAPPNSDDPFRLVFQVRRLLDAPDGSIILIDDPTPEQATVLFGRLRDELWQLPVWFTVAVGPLTVAALRQPPADAFFDTATILEPFGPETAVELLTRRRRLNPGGAEIIAPPYPMQPRALLVAGDELVTAPRYDGELQHNLLTIAENQAGRAGAALLLEIWARGAVSASDESLQHSLGIARNRLTELLRTLERVGVLVSYTKANPKATGRPRTMYDIAQVAP